MEVTQKEWDRVVKAVERNHCWRITAQIDDNSAVVVPVGEDGTIIGPVQIFEWGQLKAMARIKRPANLGRA